ncbi:MAG: deoxyguanosinetriphosphate triphosphohydrolase, partial [Candidatus Muiribacteriota bacterium]
NHDIDDAVSMKMISYRDFPKDCLDVLGKSHGKRINTMVKSVIEYCIENKKIGMADEMINVTNKLRKFMFENVYLIADEYKGSRKAYDILNIIWDYYFKNFKKLKKDFNIKKEYDTEEKILMDKISALTDKEAWIVYERIK